MKEIETTMEEALVAWKSYTHGEGQEVFLTWVTKLKELEAAVIAELKDDGGYSD